MEWSTKHLCNDYLESSVKPGELYRVHKPNRDPKSHRTSDE
jgi:hypothetical protein